MALKLSGIFAEQDPDDGWVTITWHRDDGAAVSLVCDANGTLTRTVSPYRVAEPPLRFHILGTDHLHPPTGQGEPVEP